jgi:hypothetical protein
MTAEWYKEQPTNRNYLIPVGFKLMLQLFDGVDFFCQRVNLPDISMPVTEVPTRFRNYPIVPGGGVTYGDLSVSFIIDEDLVNYKTIHDWIEKNGGANGHSPDEVEYSAAQLHILTSNMNTNHIIDYENIFPTSLSSIDFDASVSDIDYFTADITFKYTKYTIRDKNFKL